MNTNRALLIVDVQNDFCPGGALAVPNGNKVVSSLNRYIKLFSKKKLPIIASRDWHPRHSNHFKNFGGFWPVHCVQRTKGARFHPFLKLPPSTLVLSKGFQEGQDGYSAFEGVDSQKRNLFEIIQRNRIEVLYIGGLATDYCIKASVLDALKNGIKVRLLMDAIQGVNLKENDSKKAVVEMVRHGARPTTFSTVQQEL